MAATLGARFRLDGEYDATAAATRRYTAERLGLLAFCAACAWPMFGAVAALTWALAAGLCEAWLSWSLSERWRERTPGLARLSRLAATFCASGCWAWLAELGWRMGDAPARLAAAGVLVIILVYAVQAGSRAPAHLFAMMAPAALVLLSFPFSYLASIRDFTLVAAASVVLVAYIFRSAVAARASQRQLLATLDALVAEREAAQAASQAKSDFLAVISHEIRNPLNGVLGMAQAIGREELPAAQHERLEVLQESGRAVLTLVNDLLDLSRIEAGKLELDCAPFDLAALARALQLTFEPQCAPKGVGVRVEVDPSAARVWQGDVARIRQIAANLLSNAARFTARGEVVCRFAYAAPWFTIEVRDTGPGIPPERLTELFDRYSQVDELGVRLGGHGLGLGIVRQLAELMAGEVSAQSEAGQGATFTVRLPLVPAPEEALTPAEAPPAAPGGLRVLAADDHEVNRLVLSSLLAQANVAATVVENAPLLISLWESGEFDVVLLDVEMPLVDGLEAARRIRAREAATGRRRTPIVALTGNVVPRYAADHAAAGMDAVLPKPIEAANLLRTLAEVVAAAPTAEPVAPTAAAAGQGA